MVKETAVFPRGRIIANFQFSIVNPLTELDMKTMDFELTTKETHYAHT